MIERALIQEKVKRYDLTNTVISTLGSHSALDICDGAKDEGFRTLVVCQRGREKPYLHYKRIVDDAIILDKFSHIVKSEVQRKLLEKNSIFVPHRAFSTYISYEDIEENFNVPLFGNRALLRTEERNYERNQYYLLKKAGIKIPKTFLKAEEVDRLAIVKVPELKRKIERAFFLVSSYEDFKKKAKERISKGIIDEEELNKATIEEFLVGTYFNFNFFYSPLKDELEFLGIDRRLQSNYHDFVSLPAKVQLEVDFPLQNIEVGHMAATIRESLLEKVFDIGNKFVKVTKREYPPGIIGPFALQSVVTLDLDIYVYDVSPRVPGSPIIATTSPYSKYYFGEVISTGRRIAMEIKEGIRQERLEELVT
ncbi:MAG: formate--phosphoribosylaminoimidazolecarboxamide ligase family protein [Nitrososphaerales archaeon]